MNYLLQREEIPTRYFKISSAAEFIKIVKQTNENFPAILLQQFVNYICKYGCTHIHTHTHTYTQNTLVGGGLACIVLYTRRRL